VIDQSKQPQFRLARANDLDALVRMLASDELGVRREDSSAPLNQAYIDAFNHIEKDSNNELIVAEQGALPVGMLQLTFIPYLTHIGSWRCLIEGVRVHADHRGQGLGQKIIEYAIARARIRQCSLVQLTSDKQREDAIRFYQSLGFVASHEGFKLSL